MILHNASLYSVYFGNKKTSIDQHVVHDKSKNIGFSYPFDSIKKYIHANDVIFLHQTHSDTGYVVTQENKSDIKGSDGDYLITNVPQLGLGALTADCLAIIAHDPVHHALGIAHAGWRGAVTQVAVRMIERMQTEFESSPEHLKIYFGPSARMCCYEIGQDFFQYLDPFVYAQETIVEKDGKHFFDLGLFNKLQLEHAGVLKENIQMQYNSCTICDDAYVSYRRDKEKNQRNITVAALK